MWLTVFTLTHPVDAAVDAAQPRPAVIEIQGMPLPPDVGRACEPEDASDVDAPLPPDAENVDVAVDAAVPSPLPPPPHIAEVQDIPIPPDAGLAVPTSGR